MCVSSASFLETYSEEVHNMKLSILKYVKALQTKQSHPDLFFSTGNDNGLGRAGPKIILEISPDGYPILPILLPSQSWNKQDWEQLFTMYMGQHYCKVEKIYRCQMFTFLIDLATGGKSSHLPYAEIEKWPTVFIHTKYLLSTVKIRQPWNMMKLVIQEMFEYLSRQQELEGSTQAFQFKSVKLNEQIIGTQYADGMNDAMAGAGIVGPHYSTIQGSTTIGRRTPHTKETTQCMDPDLSVVCVAEATSHVHYDALGKLNNLMCTEATYKHVGQTMMERLCEAGIAMPLPCNRLPQYPIACDIYDSYIVKSVSGSNTYRPNPQITTQMIDPTLLTITPILTLSPTPMPS